MGTYTTTQEFYKPDGTEFVDVESQINYNFRRSDERVRALVEWQYTDVPTISGVLPRAVGYKWFKNSTNSLWVAPDPDLALAQHSLNGDTDAWSTASITGLLAGYQSEDLENQRLSYRREPTDGLVSWRGSMKLNNFDQIPLNTNIDVMTLAADIRPVRAKYFTVHMGIQSTNYSICRLLFMTDGTVQINRMGVNQTVSTERYISFNDIEYPTNDV